jgi:hypothetical protein
LATLDPRDRELLAKYGHLPIIDTSGIRAAKRCPRLSAWKNHAPLGLGLRAKLAAPPLTFGTLIHESLDMYYDMLAQIARGENPAIHALPHELFEHAARKKYDEIRQEHKPWPEQEAEYEAQIKLGVAMLDEYSKWAPTVDDFTVEVTERGAFIPIYKIGGWVHDGLVYDKDYPEVIGLYYVRFDGIVRDNRGRLWVMEHKTCKDWWSETMLLMDEQITRYAYAAEQWYGEPIAGVLMNFLKKEALRDPPILKSGLPTQDWGKMSHVPAARYWQTLLDVFGSGGIPGNYVDFYRRLRERDATAGHPTLRRVKLERTQDQKDEAGRRILRDLLRFTAPDAPGLDDPSPEMSCSWCAFKQPCAERESGVDESFTLKALFEKSAPIWLDHEEE